MAKYWKIIHPSGRTGSNDKTSIKTFSDVIKVLVNKGASRVTSTYLHVPTNIYLPTCTYLVMYE